MVTRSFIGLAAGLLAAEDRGLPVATFEQHQHEVITVASKGVNEATTDAIQGARVGGSDVVCDAPMMPMGALEVEVAELRSILAAIAFCAVAESASEMEVMVRVLMYATANGWPRLEAAMVATIASAVGG